MNDYEGLNSSFAEACRRADAKQRHNENKANGHATGRSDARRFILFRELEATSTKSWLAFNLLGEGDASVVYGKPGEGKSVLAEDFGLHVSAGRPWHGRKVKQGAVVFVALERRKLVERRAIAFREKHGLTDLPFAIVGGVHDFRQPSTTAALAEIIKEVEADLGQKVVLIIIDTISRALCGGDENSPKDMGAIVAATGRLQTATTAHVLWVHHVPLDGGDRLRGHGALLGAMDTTISVVKTADGLRTATVVKANDSEEGDGIAFTLESVEIGEDADGNVTTAPVVVCADRGAQRQAPKSARLPKAAQTALRALSEALSECGEPGPTSNHIPTGVLVTTIECWRQYAYRRGISPSPEPRARQLAFKRASEHLVGIEAVGIWDEHVWATR
jgi:AAA domain